VYAVDDDRDVVECISTVPQSAGYEIGAQFDVESVVDNAARFAADLAILDVMFPEDPGSTLDAAR
jgi:DNA-binding response OmpR family regulator